MSYRLKTVVSMTGIPRPTLVAWERRYGMLEPSRDESGYRVYTDEDVALLQRLKAMVHGGMAISEAIRVTGIAHPRKAAGVDPPPGGASWRPLLSALLAFDRTTADRHLPRILRMMSVRARIAAASSNISDGVLGQRRDLFRRFFFTGVSPESGLNRCSGEPHSVELRALHSRRSSHVGLGRRVLFCAPRDAQSSWRMDGRSNFRQRQVERGGGNWRRCSCPKADDRVDATDGTDQPASR